MHITHTSEYLCCVFTALHPLCEVCDFIWMFTGKSLTPLSHITSKIKSANASFYGFCGWSENVLTKRW